MTSIFDKTSINKPSFNQKIVGSLLVTSVCLLGCSPMTTSTQSASHQNGMSVYIDPQTGKFLSAPAPGQEILTINSEMQNATSTSSEGLIEEKSPIPGGGIMMDLKGRFQSPLVITQDPSGKLQSQHLNDIPNHVTQQPVEAGKKGADHEQK